MRKALRQRAAAACLCLAGLSCAPSLGDQVARDADRSVPEKFGDQQGPRSSAAAQWNELFRDPRLQALINGALHNNQELNILAQEINIANNEILARRGELLPRVALGVGAGLEKVGRHTSQGAADEANGVPEHLQDYRFGFLASWEVDVWKRLRNATQAAVYRYLSGIEGRNFMVTRVVAEIATSFYELLALDKQLEVLRRYVEIMNDALQVVRLQKEAAKATELAVKRFEAEMLRNLSRQYGLQQQITQTENRLSFLAGRFSEPIARKPEDFDALVPQVVHAGVPVELLDNRPDIRQAELELKAARLDVEVARALFYPSLSVEAELGYETFDIKHLVQTPQSMLYNLAANLIAPIWNRNALTANYFSASSQQMQAVYNYERTVLQAFMETANQVAMIRNLEKSYELRSEEVDRLTESIAISTSLFGSARADYLEVLMTRRDALESQLELIETRKLQMIAMVNVYQALGGGWRE